MSPRTTPAWIRRLSYHPPLHERDIERPLRWAAWTIGAALLVFMAGAAAWGLL